MLVFVKTKRVLIGLFCLIFLVFIFSNKKREIEFKIVSFESEMPLRNFEGKRFKRVSLFEEITKPIQSLQTPPNLVEERRANEYGVITFSDSSSNDNYQFALEVSKAVIYFNGKRIETPDHPYPPSKEGVWYHNIRVYNEKEKIGYSVVSE